jgi:hypothetical protein
LLRIVKIPSQDATLQNEIVLRGFALRPNGFGYIDGEPATYCIFVPPSIDTAAKGNDGGFPPSAWSPDR